MGVRGRLVRGLVGCLLLGASAPATGADVPRTVPEILDRTLIRPDRLPADCKLKHSAKPLRLPAGTPANDQYIRTVAGFWLDKLGPTGDAILARVTALSSQVLAYEDDEDALVVLTLVVDAKGDRSDVARHGEKTVTMLVGKSAMIFVKHDIPKSCSTAVEKILEDALAVRTGA